MSRIAPQSIAVLDIAESVGIECPIGWRKAESSLIRLLVKSRDSAIGKADYSKIIPREFVGYWYLYKDNYQFSYGAIDFKSEEIYRDKHFWNAEIVTQQMAQRVPIIETTQPEENLEEISEFVVFAGAILSNLIANTNIPILSDYLSFLTEKIEQLSSEDLSYLPAPYRPDYLYISFPAGMAVVDVEFIWYPFSPVTFGAGLLEIDLESLIELPENEDAPDPTSPIPAKSFDEIAREKGYILANECLLSSLSGLDLLARNNGYIPSSEIPTPTTYTLSIPAMNWRYANNNYSLAGATYNRKSRIKRFVIVGNNSSQTWIDKRGYGSEPQYSLLAIELENCAGISEGLIALTQIDATNPAADRLLSAVIILMNGVAITTGDYSANSMPAILTQSFICR